MEQIADYRLRRELGRGNHGTFYLAEAPARLGLDATQVTVKVLSSGSSEDTFRRVVRELQAFNAVRSPFLAPLLDAGQQGELFYYAMPYFERGTLEQPAEPATPSTIVAAVADAGRGAHALHEAGLAHRDIRPANIALGDEHAVLTDLGLAQALLPSGSVTGLGNVGSVEFMDPALLRGERASRATEIWSLGATLHRALTGRSVFGDVPFDDPLLAMRAMLSGTPTLDPSLPDAVVPVIRACIAPDPASRPGTALDVAERLDAVAVTLR